ncbi:MAG: polysaccharide deacetylase family protein [Candidatus Magasanikbacteria bacterium]
MNKQLIKRIIAKCYPFIYRDGILILNYHSVGSNNPFSLSLKNFDEQMNYITKNYNIVKLGDFSNLAGGISLVVTFDDGYEDNYLEVFPILKKYNIPATIFLTSEFILGKLDITKDWLDYKGLKPLKIDQIEEMNNSGLVSFGSHSKTHRKMSNLSKENITTEVVDSKKELEFILGTSISDFAFPFGQKKDIGVFQDELFKNSGYKTVCTTNWGINLFKSIDFYRLKRIRIDHLDSLNDFVNKIKGHWDFVRFFQSIKNFL